MNKNEKIGELYKELRLARGLKLKDIATKKTYRFATFKI